jgi:hypothetical protein
MPPRIATAVLTVAAALVLCVASAQAFDDAKYPDLKGQWVRMGGAGFDPNKPNGRGQNPPLNDEYRAIWEAALADAATGGQSYNPQARCYPGGMPRMMIGFEPIELIVRPDTTYMHVSYLNSIRRVHTDGRAWPERLEPTLVGYSIGRWVDDDGDGRYDALLIETRGFRGPRNFEASGIPLHADNKTVIKERIALDKADPNVLLDEVTVIDNALTRPWTVVRKFRRERNAVWIEHNCSESGQVYVGSETYFLSADGLLMPTGKDQPPPDLRRFEAER